MPCSLFFLIAPVILGPFEFCEKGTYRVDDLGGCSDCPKGYYMDNNDEWYCKACPYKKFGPAEGQTDANDCEKCSEGRFGTAEGLAICPAW